MSQPERAYLRALLRVWALTPYPPKVSNALRAGLVDALTKMVIAERTRLGLTDEDFEVERVRTIEELAKEGLQA